MEGTLPAGIAAQRRQRVEEIVVSARRRAEAIEDTPVAVIALSATTLLESSITRIDQIQEMVPNMSFRSGTPGNSATIQIRGVGTSTTGAAFDPGVGIYIDGVFLPRAQGSIFDVLDIEQVEVLRGPQGTLFGKNTVGGAVNVTTVKPSEEIEGSVFVRPANFGAIHTRFMMNLPIRLGWLDDRLFLRASVGTENSRGYGYNRLRDEYTDDAGGITFLGSLRLLPLDDVTVDVTGTWWKTRTRGRNGQCVYMQDRPRRARHQPGGRRTG
ncbi:MAG: TonB-dependent receptor [Deltaproteobacteria bacterium]